MINLWNVKDLNPPPTNRYIASSRDLDIKHLHYKLYGAIKIFEEQQLLHKEAALLSRYIYKLKLRLRCDKGFQGMEMTNRALRKYLHIDLLRVLTEFQDSVPQNYESETYLPSRQMFVFILVRLQGFCKLLCRIVETSEIAADHCHKRMVIGHYWNVGFLGFGILSRINIICRKFAKDVCKIYEGLLMFAPTLEEIGVPWLLDYKDLPANLHAWINVDWIYKDVAQISAQKMNEHNNICSKIYNLCESDDDVDDAEIHENEMLDTKIVHEKLNENIQWEKSSEKKLVDNKSESFHKMINLCEDFGEVLESSSSSARNVKYTSDFVTPRKNLGISENNVKLSKNQRKKQKKKLGDSAKDADNTKIHKNETDRSKLVAIPETTTTTITKKKKRKKNRQLAQENCKKFKNDENTEEEHANKNVKRVPQTEINSDAKSIEKQTSTKNIIENINSIKELELFIKKECKLRNKVMKKSLSRHLDKLQWSMLQKSILTSAKKCTDTSKTNKYLKKCKDALFVNLVVS